MIPRSSLIELFQYLKYLDQVGLPLESALITIREDPPHRRLIPILNKVHQDLTQGRLFSEALQRFDKVFSPVVVQLIQIGEKTGKLASYFEQIEIYLSWQVRLTQQAHKTLRYGLLMLVLSSAMVASLVVFLLPQIEGFLVHLGAESLPLATRTLMVFSQFCEKYGLWILGAIGSSGIIVIYWRPEWVAHFPWLGRLWIQRDLTLYLKTLAALVHARVDLLVALTQATQSIQLKFIRKQLDQIPSLIAQGETLFNAFMAVHRFPSLILRLIKLGETTGQLSELMNQAAAWAEADYAQRVERLVASLHPLLVFFLGIFILWIVVAVLLPLYQHVGVE